MLPAGRVPSGENFTGVHDDSAGRNCRITGTATHMIPVVTERRRCVPDCA